MQIEVAKKQLIKYGEELCGDTAEVLRTQDRTVVVLADGLGSGVKANILSTLTAKILVTMLADGADVKDTVETVVSTLPVCAERGVAYSTFSVLTVHHDGNAHLLEFDNPEMVLVRRGELVQLKKTVMEMDGKAISECRFRLEEGDMCVMFSDGVIHAGVGKLLNLGWRYASAADFVRRSCQRATTPHQMAGILARACQYLYMGKPGDDTTCLAIQARKEQPYTVMIGPPLEEGKDVELVETLLSSPGKKIVCGGTTSSIVSRMTGNPIQVELPSISPNIPPWGRMQGVDLVTEGVVTITKVKELVERYLAEEFLVADILRLHRGDAAAKLACMFIEDASSIHFLVGRAANPAHQKPDTVLLLSKKLESIEQLGQMLRTMGKQVEISYY